MAAKKKSPKKTKAGKKSSAKKASLAAKKPKVAARKAAPKKTKAAAKPKAAKKAKAAAKPKAAKPKAAKPKAAKKAKAAAKPKATAKTSAPKAPVKAPARRDRPGHIAPKYGRELLAKSGGPDRDVDDKGFLKRARSTDDLAERLGEEVIEEATSGENEGGDIQDEIVPEERGGPFVVTRASQEFAYEPDASNPKRSRREPFPRT
jgi:hypothetical protein